jgi:hypothetical protein
VICGNPNAAFESIASDVPAEAIASLQTLLAKEVRSEG